jgi:hypothetical protein
VRSRSVSKGFGAAVAMGGFLGVDG